MSEQRYKIITSSQLGSGAQGTVYLAIDTQTNEQVAIKQLIRQDLGLDNKLFRQEVESMSRIPYLEGENGSKYLIKYKDFYQNDNYNFIVMECFKDSMDLNTYLEKKGKIKEEDALQIFYQIALGISYLHDLRIVHRDIKPSNVLIRSKPLMIKIIDFGFARLLNAEQTTARTYVGTPMFMSPQTKLLTQYDPYANDVWSLGVLLYYMVALQYPWKAKKSDQLEKEMLNYVAQQIQIHMQGIPQFVKELILDCLQTEEQARIKSNQLAWKTKKIIQVIIEKQCQPSFILPQFNWDILNQFKPQIQYPFITDNELKTIEQEFNEQEASKYDSKIVSHKQLLQDLIDIDELIDEGLLGAFGSVLANITIKTIQHSIDISQFTPFWIRIQKNIQTYFSVCDIEKEIQALQTIIQQYKEEGLYSLVQWEKDKEFSKIIEDNIKEADSIPELVEFKESINYLKELIQ